MRKKFAIFTIFLFISTTYALQTDKLDSYKAEDKIRGFQIDSKSVFYVTEYEAVKTSPDESWTKSHSRMSSKVDSTDKFALFGTRNPGRSILLYDRDGKEIWEKSVGNWVDSLGIYNTSEGLYAAGGTHSNLEVYNRDGNLIWNENPTGVAYYPPFNSYDINNDGNNEIIVEARERWSKPHLLVRSLTGDLRWTTNTKEGPVQGNWVPGEGVLVYWDGGVSLKSVDDGDPLWSIDTGGRIDPVVNLTDSFVYSRDGELVYRSYDDGSVVEKVDTGRTVENLQKFPDRDILVGYQGENLTLLSLEGENLHSREFDDRSRYIRYTDFNNNGEKEIAVIENNKIHVLEIESEMPEIDQKLNQTVFIGNGREAFKAAVLEQDLVVSESLEKVNETVERTGKQPVGVGAKDLNGVENINNAFNVSKEKYYVEDARKLPYVAALAEQDNATLTFEKNRADRDFSGKTGKELKKDFIQEFDPNHIVLADLESDKGIIAAKMAVKDDILPVHNQYNSVIKTGELIEENFETIGENKNTVFNGKQVSILDAPRKHEHIDTGYISDPAEFRTDSPYRSKGYGVGRYPDDTYLASQMYLNSLENKEESTGIASSYLHSNWPIILSTTGGGMRHGESLENRLDSNNLENHHVVEHRSEPVEFLEELTPSQVREYIKESRQIEELLAGIASDSVAKAGKTVYLGVRGLHYGEQVLEIYYEHEWSDFGFNAERAKERFDELEVEKGDTLGETVEKNTVESLYLLFWPEKKTQKTRENLASIMDSSNNFFYIGRGNQEEWVLPNKDESYIKDRYNGSKIFDFTGIENSSDLVWDSTSTDGESEKLKRAVEKGSSSYVSYDNRKPFSSYNIQMLLRSLHEGESVGKSITESVDWFSSKGISGIENTGQEIMTKGLTVYGNPETNLVDAEKQVVENSRNCKSGVCKKELSIRPEKHQIMVDNQEHLLFNNSDYLKEDFAPITPLYRYDPEVLETDNIIRIDQNLEYTEKEDLEPVYNRLLTHSGEFYNHTIDYNKYPENKTSFNRTWNVAAIQHRKNSSKVLENAKLELEYTTPVHIELKQRNKTVSAEIYSNEDRDVELAWRTGSETFSKDLKLQKGVNSIEMKTVETGVYNFEAHVFDENVLESVQEEIRVPEDLEIDIPEKNIRKGERSSLDIEVENPNSFEITENLSVDTGEDIVLDLLEEPVKTVYIEPNNSKTVEWDIIGLDQGSSNLNISGNTGNIGIKPASSFETVLNNHRYLMDLAGKDTKFSHSSYSDKEKIEFLSGNNKLEAVSTPDKQVINLKTSDYSIKHLSNHESFTERLVQENNYFERTLSNGKIRIEGDRDLMEDMEEKSDIVERELMKFETFLE